MWNKVHCAVLLFSQSCPTATPWTAAHQASLSFTISGACSNLCPLSQWCHPTILSCCPFSSFLQSFPAAGSFQMSQFFASGGPQYWSFSFSISPSNEYSGLISFRMDWLDLLAVQGTLKNLLQYHSSELMLLNCSVFYLRARAHSLVLRNVMFYLYYESRL